MFNRVMHLSDMLDQLGEYIFTARYMSTVLDNDQELTDEERQELSRMKVFCEQLIDQIVLVEDETGEPINNYTYERVTKFYGALTFMIRKNCLIGGV